MRKGYEAFISYSHAADGQLAPAIQRGLQQLARRWNERRALEIFRDTTGLSANPGLWSSIQDALDQSRHFILLASPDAARSEWVNREIQHWMARGGDAATGRRDPGTTILAVLTDGEWWWDAASNDFDWGRSTAVPDALRGVFSEEPRHVDMRWARSETDLSLRHSRFRDQIAELAAPLHGMAKDELEGEDVRRHRFFRRLTRVVLGALAALAVAATVGGVLAIVNAQEARRAQDLAQVEADRAESAAARAQTEAERAEAEARRALARALASQAELLEHEPDLQMLLHVAALDLDAGSFTQRALLRALLSRPLVDHWRPPSVAPPIGGAVGSVDPNGEILVVTAAEDRLEVWDLADRELRTVGVLSFNEARREYVISDQPPAGNTTLPVRAIATVGAEQIIVGSLTGDVFAWDSAAGSLELLTDDCISFSALPRIGVSSDGRSIAVHCASLSAEQGFRLDLIRIGAERLAVPLDGQPSDAVIAPHGKLAAVAISADDAAVNSNRWTIAFFDVSSGAETGRLDLQTGGPPMLAFSSSGDTLAVGGFDGTIALVDAASLSLVNRVPAHAAAVMSLAFSADGRTLITGDASGAVAKWTVAIDDPGRTLTRRGLFVAHASGIHSIAALEADRFVTVAAATVGWWSTSQAAIRQLIQAADVIYGLDSAQAGTVVYGGERGVVKSTVSEPEPEVLIPMEEPTPLRLVTSKDAAIIAGGSFGPALVWDGETDAELRRFDGAVPYWGMDLSPDGRLLATSFQAGGAIFEVETGLEVSRFKDEVSPTAGMTFSGDGRLLAYAIGSRVSIHDVECQMTLASSAVGIGVEALAFSPDASQVAVGFGTGRGKVILLTVPPRGTECGTSESEVPLGGASVSRHPRRACAPWHIPTTEPSSRSGRGTVGSFWSTPRVASRSRSSVRQHRIA